MRRIAFLAVTVLALLTLAAPGIDAKNGRHHGSQTTRTSTFSAKSSQAPQGGMLKVVAKVKHAHKGASFSATATVHFASGDQTVQLTRHGKSFVASGKVAVSGDETPGTVPVDVTFEYDASEQQVETEGTVQPNEDEDTDDQDGDDQDADDQDGDQTCDATTTTCSDEDQDNDDGDGTGSDD